MCEVRNHSVYQSKYLNTGIRFKNHKFRPLQITKSGKPVEDV